MEARSRTLSLALTAILVAAATVTLPALVPRNSGYPAASTFPAKVSPATATEVKLSVGGLDRDYLMQSVDGAGPFPVVVLLHGGTQSARQVWRQTSLPTLARQEKFILVAPDAIGGHWNDGRGAVLGGGRPSNADDIGFLRQVIVDVVRNHHGDPHAVFMTGASNGGFMTMYFACHAGSLLHAAANIISDLPIDQQETCQAPPLPWLSINGTDDPIVPFAGMSAGTTKHGMAQPGLLSADATFQFWAKRDHCGTVEPGPKVPHLSAADPTWAEERVCSGRNGERAEQIVLHGGGHTLPNLQYGSVIRAVVGRSNQDLDGGEVIWQFFKSTL